ALSACARVSAEDLRGHVRPIIENEYSFIMKPWTRIDQEQSFVFRRSGAEGHRGAQAVDASADPRRRAVVLCAQGLQRGLDGRYRQRGGTVGGCGLRLLRVEVRTHGRRRSPADG